VHAFCDALRLFKLGYSWAGPVSLVVPYDLTLMRPARHAAGAAGSELVRFSVGLESADDLQADLAQALALLGD
jgi:cystathionine beta-lyase